MIFLIFKHGVIRVLTLDYAQRNLQQRNVKRSQSEACQKTVSVMLGRFVKVRSGNTREFISDLSFQLSFQEPP